MVSVPQIKTQAIRFDQKILSIFFPLPRDSPILSTRDLRGKEWEKVLQADETRKQAIDFQPKLGSRHPGKTYRRGLKRLQ